MKKTKAQAKISKVMREYKAGDLHSGKGGKVVSASINSFISFSSFFKVCISWLTSGFILLELSYGY